MTLSDIIQKFFYRSKTALAIFCKELTQLDSFYSHTY